MKKILYISLLIMFVFTQSAFAKNIKVEALEDFSTSNPSEKWSVKLVENVVTKDGTVYYANSIIYGNITEIRDPKRLKRNATFTFIPVKYYDSNSGKTENIKAGLKANYSFMSDITPAGIVKQGAIAAGNHFISGFIGPGIALVEGAVKNEEDNRVKSAAISVYESTPLSYISKGTDLNIKKGQIFIMSFNLKGEEPADIPDKPNYSYTMENSD